MGKSPNCARPLVDCSPRVRRSVATDTPLPPEEPTGENPPDGAIVDYALASAAHRVVLSIYDGNGRIVRRYASDDTPPLPIVHLDKPAYWERPFAALPTSAGMHRFVWDLREQPPRAVNQDLPISAVAHDTPRVPQGPLVVPGRYAVRLQVDGATLTQPLEVVMDPRVVVSRRALEQQYVLARRLVALMDRSYAQSATAKAAGDAKTAEAYGAQNDAAASLLEIVDGADATPTSQAIEAVRALESAKEPRP